jgi:hypothetical protein
MTELLRPCAPYYSWLMAATYADSGWLTTTGIRYWSLTGVRLTLAESLMLADERQNTCGELDLRHFPTRAVILAALAEKGHRFPWALGGIWSSLTDEQAGRLTAELIRRIGPDPLKPAATLPRCVLSRWEHSSHNDDWSRSLQVGEGWRVFGDDYPHVSSEREDMQIPGCVGWGFGWGSKRLGPEVGEAGRNAVDLHVLAKGNILIEQLTPPGGSSS